MNTKIKCNQCGQQAGIKMIARENDLTRFAVFATCRNRNCERANIETLIGFTHGQYAEI